MESIELKREIGWTIKRVLRLAPKDRAFERREFEAMLEEIEACVCRNRGLNREAVRQKTSKVVEDLPTEYGPLPETMKSWEAFIAYLYAKYLKELGQL
jgi:hypothetical protein